MRRFHIKLLVIPFILSILYCCKTGSPLAVIDKSQAAEEIKIKTQSIVERTAQIDINDIILNYNVFLFSDNLDGSYRVSPVRKPIALYLAASLFSG
ncbi:MAG: hypothetical protein JW969_07420, partial [Spirochaetales bacterium]|nr:hypothetical protein [Spirochaetales bacterium]